MNSIKSSTANRSPLHRLSFGRGLAQVGRVTTQQEAAKAIRNIFAPIA